MAVISDENLENLREINRRLIVRINSIEDNQEKNRYLLDEVKELAKAKDSTAWIEIMYLLIDDLDVRKGDTITEDIDKARAAIKKLKAENARMHQP